MKLSEHFRVAPGSKVKLHDIDPAYHGKGEKEAAAAELEKHTERMRRLQYLLYADHRQSVLIILQGLDASGKDGVVAHAFGAMNPQGVRVASFKKPTEQELSHDFLWRVHRQTPARGEIVIFNRSHYEDVLAVRVHHLVASEIWSKRYDLINQFEKNLVDAGTTILKFYLHISPEEQLARFEARLDDPLRQWKISEADYDERKLWPQYVEAFEDVFHKTSTPHAPWYVIPSNHKWFRNLAISSIVCDAVDSLGLKVPPASVKLDEIRAKYHAASKAERKLEQEVLRR
jgi:PPK2 family polyphosphate:nucleotide phosphotransferase